MNINWNEFTISAIGDVVGGGTPSTKNNEYYGDEISWITPKDLSNFNERYISRGERSISQKGYDNSSAQMLPAGTVLFSSRAPIGYVAIAQNELCTNQGFKSVIPHPEVCDSEFLYYLLCYRKHDIEAIASGTTFMEVSGTALKNFVVRIPDISTQKKIAQILSSLDEKIEQNAQINHNLEEQAALIFADWLQGCNESVAIGDLSTNILDYTPINNGFVRLLNSSEVTEGVFPDIQLVPNANLKGHFKKRFQLGDILYSEIRPRNHHYGFVLFDASEYIASTRLMVIRALDYKVSPAMLYQYLLLPNVEAEFTLKTESRSGTFPQGNYADIASIKIPYAPVKAQNEVSSTLTKIRQTIANNQLENRQLSELRDALLPKLMSGEIDVSEVEV